MIYSRQIELEEESPLAQINPLYLAVGLIVLTILVAAGLSFWASGIGKKGSIKDCSLADFRLYSGSYDSSKGSMSLRLENLGPSELSDLTVYVFYTDDKMVEKILEKPLSVGKINSYDIEDIPKDFESGVIKTSCPDVNLKFTRNNQTLTEV